MAVQDALAATSTRLLPLRPRTTRDGNSKRVRFNNDDSNCDAVVVHVLEIPRARASTSESSDASEAESESESESDTDDDADADADESDERLRLNFNTISISRMPVHTESQSGAAPKTTKTASLRESSDAGRIKTDNGPDAGVHARKSEENAARVLSNANSQRGPRNITNGSLTIGKPKAPDVDLSAARVRPKSAYPGVHFVNHSDSSAKRMVRPNFSRPLRRNYSAASAVRLSKNAPTWRGDRFWFDESEPDGKRDNDSVQHRLRRLRNSNDMQMLMMPSLTRNPSDAASKEAKLRAGDWMVANGLRSSREPLDVKPMFN